MIAASILENATEISGEELSKAAEQVAKDPSYLSKFIEKYGSVLLAWGIQIAIAIIVFLVGLKLIKYLVKIVKKSLEFRGTEAGVTSFLCSVVHYGLDFILAMVILSRFGLSGSIVAVLGSVGITVGLALQGSLSNFAGGVLIVVLKPFLVGDYIIDSAAGVEGTVSAITVFYTKVITPDNKIIVVPNGSLSNTTIVNVNKNEMRRLDINVGVGYESDIQKVKAVLTNLAMNEENVLKDQPVDVIVKDLADSSVTMEIHVWVEAPNYLSTKFKMLEDILITFRKEGINIPYNIVEVKNS